MSSVGIIAEYNPFHNGHAHQIRSAREKTGADYVVVVMSPDFVQRGCPAMADKYTRAHMALLGGADLVLELPVFWACGSAEFFAEGAVKMLRDLVCVDYLSFGCEDPDLEDLWAIADILASEPPLYRETLRRLLAQGKSFPQAREAALSAFATDSQSDYLPPFDSGHLPGVLARPNNILALEYLKAIRRLDCSLEPVPIERTDVGYNSTSFDLKQGFASAKAIREMICLPEEPWRKRISPFIPQRCLNVLGQDLRERMLRTNSLYDRMLHFALLSCQDYCACQDVSEDMARRILKLLPLYRSARQFASLVKSRQLTETRINRALLHILLGITKKDVDECRSRPSTPYARILGFKKSSSQILRDISQNSKVPLITKNADADEILGMNTRELDWFLRDIYASHIYQLLSCEDEAPIRSEYTCSPVIC